MGRIYATCLVGLAVVLLACGGDTNEPGRILQLSEGSFSEIHYRGLLSESIFADEASTLICDNLENLTDEQAVEAHPTISALVISYSVTPAPPQEPNAADIKRAVQLLRDECGNRPLVE